MKASSTVENYLKALYVLEQRGDRDLVQLGKLAERLEVTPGTATTMVKRLADSGLVRYEPRGGVLLTAKGEDMALQVLRRHRLIELFLVEVLGLDWDEVHEEAEVLEHAISDRVLARIDEMLGFPTTDPHGDPIPDATGKISRREVKRLSECPPGDVRIARVGDQDSSFLRFLHERGLIPGATVRVEERDEMADVMTVRAPGKEPIQIGLGSASKVFVAHD